MPRSQTPIITETASGSEAPAVIDQVWKLLAGAIDHNLPPTIANPILDAITVANSKRRLLVEGIAGLHSVTQAVRELSAEIEFAGENDLSENMVALLSNFQETLVESAETLRDILSGTAMVVQRVDAIRRQCLEDPPSVSCATGPLALPTAQPVASGSGEGRGGRGRGRARGRGRGRGGRGRGGVASPRVASEPQEEEHERRSVERFSPTPTMVDTVEARSVSSGTRSRVGVCNFSSL
ncbi:hypothetical protein C356_02641 [Cryptococcus neoformans c45]|nr:hypothetical protein C356_02641 [Cryptococcus neoformans var. grubii c45]